MLVHMGIWHYDAGAQAPMISAPMVSTLVLVFLQVSGFCNGNVFEDFVFHHNLANGAFIATSELNITTVFE